MASSNPLVSIVILNWNGLEDTKLCLEYVRQLHYSNYEIIVVDNGSSAEDKKYLSSLKDIVYIDNPENRGFAGGQSDGYKQAKGDFILLLNNDAVIHPDYIDRAMPLFNDPSVAVVGGRSYFWNDEEPVLNTSNRFYAYMDVHPVTAETTLRMEDYGEIQEVNVVSGSAVIVRKSVTEHVGYLWEPFFAYYEETDLFARIKRAGYKVLYHPGLYIWHKNGASSGAQSGSPFFYYHIFRNRYMFAIRNFDDAYFEKFKKSYLTSYRKAQLERSRSATHRVIAKAYVKAVKEIKKREASLLQDREELRESLQNDTYSQLIIAEQQSLSIVIDGSRLTQRTLAKLSNELSVKYNPRLEYIIVVPQNVKTPAETTSVRFVINKQYFDTPSINLGCIAARNDWIVITSPESIKDPAYYIDLLVKNYGANAKAINLNNKSSVLIAKSLFILMGGLRASTSLEKNIQYILQYTHVDRSLISQKPISLLPEKVETIKHQLHLDYELLELNESTLWQRLLNKYYRLQQLTNLITWYAHPKLPLRLKAGRSKNLALSIATLNRERLATELKHMRNEVYRQSKYQKALLVDDVKRQSATYTKKQEKKPSTIPVFIITYERVNDLKKLVKNLEALGLTRIVFIDNGSTYPPLLQYLNKTPYQVLKLRRNTGHTAPWKEAIIRSLIPYGYYIVTDPDVIPSETCLDATPIKQMIEIHKKYPYHQKVGLSLKIDDLPDHYPLKKDVIAWEQQFWTTPLEDNIYEASVDTTFALYKPASYTYVLGPSIRIGEPYSARHMPWYNNPAKLTDEDIFYKNRADTSVTSWNVDTLPERYKKEMARGQ